MTILGGALLAEAKTVRLLSREGEEIGRVTLPKVFSTRPRPELVKRVFVAMLTHRLQPKGAWKGSGHKYSVESLGPGYGLARIHRVKASGTGKGNAGGLVPTAVGGRPTHPPVPEKKIHKDVNRKEKDAALASALAFTAMREFVRGRGHRVPDELELPIVVEDSFQSISKTKELLAFMNKLGLGEELSRCKERKIRAGRGKMRGRRYKRRVGPLIVVERDEGIGKAAGSIRGVDVVRAKDLSVLHLAPGGVAGRLCIFTVSSLKVLEGRVKP